MSGKKPLGIPDDVEKKEYFDDADKFAKKLDVLAEWIKESEHCIFFTGAGISTSTGIPDFRSGMNTVLSTGPGIWELRDKGAKRQPKKEKTKTVLQAMPSLTHMSLVELQRHGYIKFVVSQNVDGLHLRSGLHPDALAELHGNTNLEVCGRCGMRYLRDFRTRTSRQVHDHYTGRTCDDLKCRGRLKDSIINFGEDLPEKELSDSYQHAEDADLCISLGSSLRVSPANEIPSRVAVRGKRLVIGNLQRTPLHSISGLQIHAMCDDVMKGLMERLELPIPKWELKRRVKVSLQIPSSPSSNGSYLIKLSAIGLDAERDVPYSLFRKVIFAVIGKSSQEKLIKEVKTEPFSTSVNIGAKSEAEVSIELYFQQHYGEPPLLLKQQIAHKGPAINKEYLLYYDPLERKWRVTEKE